MQAFKIFDFTDNITNYLPLSTISTTKGITGFVDPNNIGVAYNYTNRTITLTHSSGTIQYF